MEMDFILKLGLRNGVNHSKGVKVNNYKKLVQKKINVS